jgi:Spy/CpxP family protein refolding chaperone
MGTTVSGCRRWMLMAAAVLVIGGGGVAVVRAQPGPDPAGPCARQEGFLTRHDRDAMGRILGERIKEKLGLTDQQSDQIRATLETRRSETRADVQALCEARVELRRLLERQDSDPAALKEAAERVKALQGKLLDRRLEAQIALRAQLTPEQWAKWIEMRKGRGHRWMGRGRGIAS